jgi:hypothetical protein
MGQVIPLTGSRKRAVELYKHKPLAVPVYAGEFQVKYADPDEVRVGTRNRYCYLYHLTLLRYTETSFEQADAYAFEEEVAKIYEAFARSVSGRVRIVNCTANPNGFKLPQE